MSDFILDIEAYNPALPVETTPAYTFTRATTAYNEDGSVAASGEARFTRRGKFGDAIFIEEGTSNLIASADDMSNASVWVPSAGITYQQKDTAGRLGASSATTITDGNNTLSACTCTATVTAGLMYVYSVYVKKVSSYTCSAGITFSPTVEGNVYVDLDPQTGIGLLQSNATSSNFRVEDAGDFWRVSCWGTSTGTTINCRVYPAINSDRSNVYNVNATGSNVFECPQLEQKTHTHPTSWTLTDRNAEICTIPTSGILNATSGTVEFWVYFNNTDTVNSQRVISLSSTSNTGLLALNRIKVTGYDDFRLFHCNGTSNTILSASFPTNDKEWYHIAITWDANFIQMFVNGNHVIVDAAKYSGFAFDSTSYIGSNSAGAYQVNGYIDDLRISNIARTSAEIFASYSSGKKVLWDAYTTALYRFDKVGLKTLRYCTGLGVAYGGNYYEPVVKNPGSLKVMMFAEGTTKGASKIGYGEIILNNAEGDLDELLDYGFDGRTVQIRELIDNSTIGLSMKVSMEQPVHGNKEVSLRLKDPQIKLAVPIQPTKYAGNNTLPAGVEGTTDIKGKPKPLVFGEVFNVTPICVNTSRLIYQVNDGSLNAISAVYDKGVSLDFGVARSTQADLEANAPEAGHYDTWLGGGMFRLGSSPAGVVTCDAARESSTNDRTAPIIMKTMALRALTSAEVNTTEFDNLGSTIGYHRCGIYISSETNVSAALDEVANSEGLWYGFDFTSVLRVGQLVSPSGSSVLDITRDDVIELNKISTKDEGGGLPVHKVNLNYKKNFTVQTKDSLAGSLIIDKWRFIDITNSYQACGNFINGLFVFVTSGGYLHKSIDGVSWITSSTTTRAFDVSCSGGSSIIFGSSTVSTSNLLLSTNNGSTLSDSSVLPAACYAKDIIYGNGVFILVSGDRTNVYKSTNGGSSWTTITSLTKWYDKGVYANGKFFLIIAGSPNYMAVTNDDGATWSEYTPTGITGTVTKMVYGNGVILASVLGGTGGVKVYASTNGVDWIAAVTTSTSEFFVNMSYGYGLFYRIFVDTNSNPTVEWSSDGFTWSKDYDFSLKGYNPNYNAVVVFGNNRFVVSVHKSGTSDNGFGYHNMLPAELEFLTNQYRTLSVGDSNIKTVHPLSIELTLNTLLTVESDASTEATRQLNLRKVRRDYVEVRIPRNLLTTTLPKLGSITKLTYPRYGYDNGKLFVLIGYDIDLSTNIISLFLWG